jgi:hypothetical protein
MTGKPAGMEMRSDRRYRVALPRDELWARVATVGIYRAWWPWLRRFDATALAPGEVWYWSLRPPLPYAIGGEVHLHTVVQPTFIGAVISGDLAGRAHLEFQSTSTGTEVRLVSRLVARREPLRTVARMMPWFARRTHDWVLDSAARQFSDWVALHARTEPAPAPHLRH